MHFCETTTKLFKNSQPLVSWALSDSPDLHISDFFFCYFFLEKHYQVVHKYFDRI